MDALPMTWLLSVHLAATLFMTGLIWFVQIVHYPLFDGVGQDRFAAYSQRHQHTTTFVVAPAMLIEALSALGLVWRPPRDVAGWVPWTGMGLVMFLFVITAAVSVPEHGRLARGFDPHAHRRLVTTNWLRTAAWTIRSGLALAMIWPALQTAAPVE